MDKYVRLAPGDKVRIIDEESPHHGRMGKVKDVGEKPLIMLNAKSGAKSGKMKTVAIEIEGVDDLVIIYSHPKPLDSQIRKL